MLINTDARASDHVTLSELRKRAGSRDAILTKTLARLRRHWVSICAAWFPEYQRGGWDHRLCCKDFVLATDHLREDEMTSQAITLNSLAMDSAWALMSLPPMFRTCPS